MEMNLDRVAVAAYRKQAVALEVVGDIVADFIFVQIIAVNQELCIVSVSQHNFLRLGKDSVSELIIACPKPFRTEHFTENESALNSASGAVMIIKYAAVTELADVQDLGSCAERRVGSNPTGRIR
jgi:hypothetical protein